MRCDLVREHVDAHLAGTLEPSLRRAVDEHLAGCRECRAVVDDAGWIHSRTVRLAREITPDRDLWQGISARLEHHRSRRLSAPAWWVAAAAVLLVATTSLVTVVLTRSPTGAAASGFAVAEAGYLQATRELALLYRQHRDSLAPGTREIVERNLVVIERALNESREALRSDPFNRTLEDLVAAAYRRKIEFLERAATLGRES